MPFGIASRGFAVMGGPVDLAKVEWMLPLKVEVAMRHQLEVTVKVRR